MRRKGRQSNLNCTSINWRFTAEGMARTSIDTLCVGLRHGLNEFLAFAMVETQEDLANIDAIRA